MGSQGSVAFLVDLGSTFTKGVAVDLTTGKILAQHRTASTVETDVRIGLDKVLQKLSTAAMIDEPSLSLASSSAAGGLNMVAIGLVPELTGEAARLSALGAGAKVSASMGYKLTATDREQIIQLSPDIILLAGGTDGGDEEVALHNARLLAGLRQMTVVYAGNRVVADEVRHILVDAGHMVIVTENVLPRIQEINASPAQAAIRDLFLDRIVQAKGLDRAKELVDGIIMATPAAVLRAAEVLHGSNDLPGDLVLVDVGGATTDVVSASDGAPTEPGLIPVGLKEPFYKRTVEGDLGLRHNAKVIAESVSPQRIAQLSSMDEGVAIRYLDKVSGDPSYIPAGENELAIDSVLARVAVKQAASRHAGRLEPVFFSGKKDLFRLHGKDLRNVQCLIGTGGIFTTAAGPHVLRSALFDWNEPESLRPQSAALLVDTNYVMFAIGLLASQDTAAALRLAKTSLVNVPPPVPAHESEGPY